MFEKYSRKFSLSRQALFGSGPAVVELAVDMCCLCPAFAALYCLFWRLLPWIALMITSWCLVCILCFDILITLLSVVSLLLLMVSSARHYPCVRVVSDIFNARSMCGIPQ